MNICIGRQLGSGGREIACRLAEMLGYKFYDKELLNLAAKESGFSEESLFQFQSDAIRKAAYEGNCVFVGRCADYILRDRTDMLSVFITADLDWRAQQVISRHKCSKDEALKIIHNAESQRASYYNYYTGKRWGDSASYDLCVNSCRLGLDATAQLVRDFIVKSSKL